MTEPSDLAVLLGAVADGRPPPPDGRVSVLPRPSGRVDALLGFFAHHVVAAPVQPDDVQVTLPADDLGAPLKPPFLSWLGTRLGVAAGGLDVVLVGRGTGRVSGAIVKREDLTAHPRVARGLAYRDDVTVLADQRERGVVLLGRGLAGRLEVSFEVDPAHRRRGLGLALATAALGAVPAGEPLWAQVSPGNAASLRLLLAVGFTPVGAEVLFLRHS